MKIETQRCFHIHKHKLDLFLVALNVNFSGSMSYFQADYIFDEKKHYAVVVSQYGGRDQYEEKQLHNFVDNLWTNKL